MSAKYRDKPTTVYSFLDEFEESAADQISIEAAQPHLDLSMLEALPSKTVMVDVIDVGDQDCISRLDALVPKPRAR